MKTANPKSTADAVKTRIVVADDHPLLREALAQLIDKQHGLTVCAQAGTVNETLAVVDDCEPDLLLLDLRMGEGDGLELIKSLKAQHPKLHILVLSQFDESLYAVRALRAGASGYVMKQEASEEVLTAIKTVSSGEVYVSRRIAVLLFRANLEPRTPEERTSVEKLSDRELHVFQLLGGGMSTREIANTLKIAVKTVEAHRENIKAKLELRGAEELVGAARRWVEKQGPGRS